MRSSSYLGKGKKSNTYARAKAYSAIHWINRCITYDLRCIWEGEQKECSDHCVWAFDYHLDAYISYGFVLLNVCVTNFDRYPSECKMNSS